MVLLFFIDISSAHIIVYNISIHIAIPMPGQTIYREIITKKVIERTVQGKQ
jgi:hypothetical protein